MSLISVNKFDQYISLIRELEDSEGAIAEKNQDELIEIKREIASSVDSTVRYRKYLSESISKYKSAIKYFVEVQEKKLERLDDFLRFTLDFTGPLKTPFSSLKIQSRKYQKVLVTDFDLVMKTYPEAVTISDFDNVRTIRLSKDYLIKIKEPIGFIINETETKFIDAREKTQKERQDAVTENENL